MSVRVPGEVLFKRSSSFGRIYDDVLLLAAGRRNGQYSAPAAAAARQHKARRTRIRTASSHSVPPCVAPYHKNVYPVLPAKENHFFSSFKLST